MTEIHLHFLFAHYGLYGNAPASGIQRHQTLSGSEAGEYDRVFMGGELLDAFEGTRVSYAIVVTGGLSQIGAAHLVQVCHVDRPFRRMRRWVGAFHDSSVQ